MKTKNYFKKAAILVLVFSTQFIMAQVPSYVPTNGLKAYYPFSGNANDASGNANNGTVNGATLTTDRFGSANSAYSFDGISNYINIANNILPTTSTSLTVSLWFLSSDNDGHLISDRSGAGNTNKYSISTGGTVLGSGCENGNCSGSCGQYLTTLAPSGTNWNNAILVKDMSLNVCKIYLNGVLAATRNNFCYTNFSSPTAIGRGNSYYAPFADGYVNGKIDDVGIWNRALTEAEITTMYNGVASYSDNCNAVSGSLTQGLVGYWPFCGNANDDSGLGNNGTVNGATLTTDRFGNANAAYNFNGTSSYIEIPHSTSINFGTQDFTISAWAKPSQFLNTDQAIITKERVLAQDNNQFRMCIQRSANVNQSDKHYFFTSATPPSGIGLNWTPTTGYVLQSNSIAPTTTWSLITIVRTGVTYKLYINGILNSTDNTINGLVQDYSLNLQNLVFGASKEATGTGKVGFFNGIIDDIGFWNRALTTQEITQLYNQNQCFTNTTVTDTLVINVGQMGFNPVTYANNITVYPNPASTQVTISFNAITDLNGGVIKIINSLGQQVATTPITTSGTNTSMTLSTWGGSGLYFVQIVNPQGQIVDIKKILLQ